MAPKSTAISPIRSNKFHFGYLAFSSQSDLILHFTPKERLQANHKLYERLSPRQRDA